MNLWNMEGWKGWRVTPPLKYHIDFDKKKEIM